MRKLLLTGLPVVVSTLFSSFAVADKLDKWHLEGRNLFEQVVNIPTVEGRGNMGNLVALLKSRFEAVGFTDITVKSYNDTQTMILRWSSTAKNKPKPILLLAHMDVVEALPADWSFDPFIFQEIDGYYYGRGSIDNKAGLLAITMSMLRLKKEGFTPKRDIIVLFTGDEETTGKGAELASTEWKDLVDAEYALNSDAGGGAFLKDGTPLGFGIQAAEKTYRTYTLSVRNPGGHSSRPRPDNAIYELATALKKLEVFSFEPGFNEVTKAYFTERAKIETGKLGEAMRRWVANPDDREAADFIEADPSEVGTTRTRCVATQLEGGHAENALPQLAMATVNCRILPGIDPADIEAGLKQLVGEGVEVKMSEAYGTPTDASPLRDDVVSAYTKAVQKRHPGMSIIPSMSTGATDGLFFRAVGIPVYGVSGEWIISPEDERAHGRDERNPVKSFHQNLDIWYEMISELAG